MLRIRHPEEQLAAVAPLLCAGITTYSPLRHWNVGPGKKVGIVGIGGLGHMGIKLAHAMGAHVVAFTTSRGKRQDALRPRRRRSGRLAQRGRDGRRTRTASISSSTPSPRSHDLDAFTALLKRDGTLVLVGVPEHAASVARRSFNLIFKRRAIAGSLIGGIARDAGDARLLRRARASSPT